MRHVIALPRRPVIAIGRAFAVTLFAVQAFGIVAVGVIFMFVGDMDAAIDGKDADRTIPSLIIVGSFVAVIGALILVSGLVQTARKGVTLILAIPALATEGFAIVVETSWLVDRVQHDAYYRSLGFDTSGIIESIAVIASCILGATFIVAVTARSVRRQSHPAP